MLGKYELNKIYNEDSYKAIKNIPDNSIDCIYVDVPYLYQKGGAGSKLLGQRMVKINEEIKDMSDGFEHAILTEFIRVLKRINVFIWCSKAQILDIMNFFNQYNVNFELLVWCKTNPVPRNQSWNSDVEYCLVFREKQFPLNSGYELKSKWTISPINKRDKDIFEHPTIKPLSFVKQHVLHSTQENDIVLDCFMGSGTTGVACKETNRRFIGFEIDPKFCKIANDRLNGITASGQMSIFTNFEI